MVTSVGREVAKEQCVGKEMGISGNYWLSFCDLLDNIKVPVSSSISPSASDAEMLNSICIKFCLCLFFCTDAANNENVHTYASAFNLQKVLYNF